MVRIKGLWCPPGVPLRSFPTGGRLRACGVHPVSVARFSHESHPKHSEAHSAREQGSAFPVEAPPRYKIRLQLTRHPRTYCVSRSFSLQEICSREDRRFLFSLQQPETDVDGQALWHFALLYFGAIISSAGGVLSRVLWNFFSLEDLHEVFSPRSTRYNPKAARWPGLPFISNSSSIFGSLVCRSRQTAELFLHGRSFFRSAEQSPVVAGITPSPTGVVFTTSTDSYPATLSQPWSSCSTHLLRRVLLSYSFRDQRKNLPWNDVTPPTFSSPPLTLLRVRDNLSCPPDINAASFLQGFIVTCRPLGAPHRCLSRSYEFA